MKPTFFIFLRHAESEKNIVETVGGTGKKLTILGLQQAETISQLLYQSLGTSTCDIISSPAIQAVETSNIISKHFCRTTEVSNALTPANMGIVTGMKEAAIQEHFPDIAISFQKWRACEIEACELSIPGKESPEAFWNRMLDFLNSHAEGGVKIIVATRSIMVFAKNLIQNKLPHKGGGYKHTNVSHCEVISFIWDNGIPITVPVEKWKEVCNG